IRDAGTVELRRYALKNLYKAMRRADRFASHWNALGGAKGICTLMADFSVVDVRQLCTYFGYTASAKAVRTERQTALAELVRLLHAPDSADKRPLESFYQHIVPASTEEIITEWENNGVEWTMSERRMLANAHPERYEKRFLGEIFSPENTDIDFSSGKQLFSTSWDFTYEILTQLSEAKGKIRIPHDFIEVFVNPRLARSLKSRYTDEFRVSLFNKIVSCVKKHESLAGRLNFHHGGLFRLTVKQWEKQAGQKEDFERLLATLVSLMSTALIRDVDSVKTILEIVDRKLRYQLMVLVFRHAKRYEAEIDDDSEEGIEVLQKLLAKDRWPADFFTTVLDNADAMALFRRLMRVYPTASFLYPATGYKSTVLKQTRTPGSANGDPEVLECRLILQSKNPLNNHGTAWRDRVAISVQDRKKRAFEAREWKDRAFWASSALRLCIAAGLRQLYADTLLWARRFTKDALTVKQLYASDVLETQEGKDLLVGFPEHWIHDIETTKDDIEAANAILLDLIETAAAAITEPSFQLSDWRAALNLPQEIVRGRLDQVSALEERLGLAKSQTLEVIWKPTIDLLLRIEQFAAKSENGALQLRNLRFTAGSLGENLVHKHPAPLRANLTSYVMEGMKERLEPSLVAKHTGNVVSMVKSIASSSQPTLACPFIRELIVDGDNNNSAWHRQLFNVGFLSYIPPKAARAFLYDMVNAIRDRLIEQNARRVKPKQAPETATPKSTTLVKATSEAAPRERYVKVTTVKMMAEVLRDVRYIDMTSACDVLIGLLPHARHVDIHIAVVESLLATLADPASPGELRGKILDALDGNTIPVAAELSERNPMTKEDWAAAAASTEAPLPEVTEGTEMPPILALLVEKERSAPLSEEDKSRLARLVMSVLEQSASNNARWMSLFLKKHDFRLDPGVELPKAPVKLGMLTELFLHWTQYMPESAFEMLKGVVLTNLRPPQCIDKITTAVRINKDLASSNAGKHWLSQFANSGPAALRLGALDSAVVLHRPEQDVKSKIQDGITFPMLQRFVLSVADVLIDSSDAQLLETLCTQLCVNRDGSGDGPKSRLFYDSWKAHSLPVLRETISRVEKSTPAGFDRVRPNSFLLRIRALQAPYFDREVPSPPAEVADFISELSGLVSYLAARRLPYHEDWAELKNTVLNMSGRSDFADFAARLGDLEDVDLAALTLADYLRVELASSLLLAAGQPREPGVPDAVREMVANWRQCEVEGIRAAGAR
ncbi:hypothetical protein GQ53DRAFT_627958, partial [Thozetella sp. PMI_491]